MKKLMVIAFVSLIIFALPSVCSASEALPCIFVDSSLIEPGSDFVMHEGSIYGRAERLSEIFGYILSTDSDGYVHSFSDNTRTVTYDSYAGTVNIGDRHSFAHEIYDNAYIPFVSDGDALNNFIPLRMLCEAFDTSIVYDEIKNEVYITRSLFEKGLYNSHGTAISYRNGKYGLVNESGTLIMNYRYDDINNYDNPLLFKVTANHRCGLADSNGNIIVDVQYNEIIYGSDAEIYLVQGNTMGMCDMYGNIIIPVEYEDIVYSGNRIAMVKDGSKWRVLHCTGNVLGSKIYDNVYKVTTGIQTDNNNIKGYYVEKNGKWGYIDSFGTLIIDLKYDALDKFDVFGRARVISNGKFGIIDCGGKVIIPTAYDYIYPFGNLDVAVAQVGNKYGAINLNGTPVIPFEYDYIYSFNDAPSAICYKDGKFGVISSENGLLTDLEYSYAEEFKAGKALVYKNGYGFVDHSGNEIVECIHAEVKQGSALSMFLKHEDNWALFSSTGKNLTGFIYETADAFSNGLSAVSITANGKSRYGYVNDSGDIVIAHIYDTAQDFNYGKAIVSKDNVYGIIDVEGNVVIPFEYKGFNPSYDYNLIAAAGINGKWGVITFANEIIAGFEFDYVFEYTGGYAVVLKANKYGVIDTKGKTVVSITHKSYDDAVKMIDTINQN